MAISTELFLAILAMDAYNRGYGAGLKVDGNRIGDATLGRATNPDVEPEAVAAGFFAQAYTLNTGQTVISYRGTDNRNPFDLSSDIWTGWPLGAGVFDCAQGALAIEFFKKVVAEAKGVAVGDLTLDDLYAASVALTGHSMGGGLAGFIASLYGPKFALGFDPMEFYPAASNLIAAAYSGTSDLLPQAIRNMYFLGDAPLAPNKAGFASYAVDGESLSSGLTGMAGASSAYLAEPRFDLGFSGVLAADQRHSQDLLVIRMFADEYGTENDWTKASQYVLPRLFEDRIATPLGIVSGGATGTDSAAGKMRTMIAYSAIDSGTMPYGNKAIRALYDDMNEFGRLLQSEGLAAYLKGPRVLDAVGDLIGEYAGLLARNAETKGANGNTGFEKGAIFYDEPNKLLVGDFGRDMWRRADNGATVNIVGKKSLTDAVSAFNTIASTSSFDQAIQEKWAGSTEHVIKLFAATEDENVELSVADGDLPEGSLPGDGIMLVGAGGDDDIIGGKGRDLLLGGEGQDTLIGGGGDDLMFGGAGDDTFQGYDDDHRAPTGELTGYEGGDWIDGGAGTDTVDYSRSKGAVTITLSGENQKAAGRNTVRVNDDGTGSEDVLASIEEIKLGSTKDTVVVKPFGGGPAGRYYESATPSDQPRTHIDMGGEPKEAKGDLSQGDTLDFSQYGSKLIYMQQAKGDQKGYELYLDKDFQKASGLSFSNVESIKLSSAGEQVKIKSAGATASSLARDDSAQQMQTFAETNGSDNKDETATLLIDLGAGDDVLLEAPEGSRIRTGEGKDDIRFANNIGIEDLSSQDRLTIGHDLEFHGGMRYMWSESPWATSLGGLFKSGVDQDGELVVKTEGLGTVYVLNWQASAGLPFEQRPGQISLFEYDMGAYRLLDPNKPSNMTQMGTWDFLGAYVKSNLGQEIWSGVDPITLDLDGNGFSVTWRQTFSPRFDMDGDGYLERTGWVGPDDGILARDLDGDGRINDVTEMFGGSQPGFAALAQLDGNADGKIDALDNGLADFNGDGVIDASDTFDTLKVWRDLDGDAVTDPGELVPLADLGIASISVQSTKQDKVFVNGNQVAATAGFTRTDGTTGTAGGDKARDNNSTLSRSSEPQGQELVYSARISLDRTRMRIDDRLVNLAPGMAVTVEIKTGQRRIVEYVLAPLLRYRQESLRER